MRAFLLLLAAPLLASCLEEDAALDFAGDDECAAEGCALHALQRRGERALASPAGPDDDVDLGAEYRGRRRRRRVSRRRSASGGHPVVKGVSYGPFPCKGRCEIHMDDFMTEAAKPLWGPRGRGDLATMAAMGANAVRLYGNSPTNDHSSFLDEAQAQKLKVVAGISDYPYTQMKKNCLLHTDLNCYEMVKEWYKLNLLMGFVEDGAYHPALSTIIVVNEPDLKLPGSHSPRKFAKAIISALDGVLDAEKEVGVTGNLVNFTATFSFGQCFACDAKPEWRAKPALGQMAELEDAMMHPEAYGYTPKNDLAKLYRTRWAHSFNTNAPADYLEKDFLPFYESHFLSTPVAVWEYHTRHKNAYKDFGAILHMAEHSPLLLGASFFEFQVRYDKGGSEMEFGMFGLGSYSFGSFDYFGSDYGSWCLTQVQDEYGSMPQLVAKAMGGKGPEWEMLCAPDPAKVPLTPEGYAQIAAQDPGRVAHFMARVVRHLGGTVTSMQGLATYAADLQTAGGVPEENFGSLVGALANPDGFATTWRRLDSSARCVADRESDAAQVGAAVAWACGEAKKFNCSDAPLSCTGSVWATADWVFSHFYDLEAEGKSPLENCYMGGAAVYARSDYVGRKCGDVCCGYKGQKSGPATAEPTLPPKFDPEFKSTTPGVPTPSPKLVGDCSFREHPTLAYFWDVRCRGHGGPGCKADGKHMECRFCGRQPFPTCPTSEDDLPSPEAPAPGPPSAFTGECSFANEPALPYFWDESCIPKGGPGCHSDGKHMACRLCGRQPFPDCPFTP